jgi:hypothetical protein
LFHAFENMNWIRQATLGLGGDFDRQTERADAIRDGLQLFCG